MKKFNIKALATSLSLAMTAPLAMTAQASDIEIYQETTSGATSLVFMLDISGSMHINSVAEDYVRDDNGGALSWYNDTSSNLVYGVAPNVYRYRTEPGFSGYDRFYRRIEKSQGDFSTAVKEQCVLDNGFYKCYSRMSRLLDAFYLLLNGGKDLQGVDITKLDDAKVIGLSTLGIYNNNQYVNSGRIIVPARRLGAVVNGKTQRQILTEEMSKLTPRTNTPTARSFAEVVAYFMGTNTTNVPAGYKTSGVKQYVYIPELNKHYNCQNTFPTRCNAAGAGQYFLTDSHSFATGPLGSDAEVVAENSDYAVTVNGRNGTSYTAYTYIKHPDKVVGISGFRHSTPSTKNGSNYISPLDTPSCAAQGIYVLTDGQPTEDSGSQPLFISAFGEDMACKGGGSSFYCAIAASEKLFAGTHKKNMQIKTAVVGFGSVFTQIPSYDRALTKEENLAKLGIKNGDVTTIDQLNSNDKEQLRAAAWGIVGGGGWYSGASTTSVVDSVNKFLTTLTVDIPVITTGSPTVPVSSLNRQSLLADAYYASFAPQPSKAQQLWTGNMNKYKTQNGALHGKSNQPLFQTNGLIDTNTLGLWDKEVNGEVLAGVAGNLKLRTDAQGNTQRKVYTESNSNNRTLTPVTVDALSKGSFSDATNHWLNLLGYRVSESETVDFNQLSSKPELRQLGSTMHSSPILLTQSGKIDSTLKETDRDDYVVYGSTQGVLHIVDADTGVEKFAFVPQKMVEKQKQAFLHEESTIGGKNKLFYGIDGVWVNHTEYVVRTDGALTVGASDPTDKDSPRGRQWIYGGLRMGGKNYYGLDLSGVANNTKKFNDNGELVNEGQVTGEPVLKFNIDPDAQAVFSATGSTTYPELAHMGQSWSKPALGYVRWNGTRRLVMFVGGGYDEGYEASDYQQNNGKGAGVYMFDANTGELLWWASNNTVTGGKATKHSNADDDTSSLQYSVVSRINTVDRDSNGLIDALYFGDLAGQGFRIDLNNSATATSGFSLRVVKIFDEHKADGTSPRFYDMPSISVHDADEVGRFAVVAFGSGDRSSPLAGARVDVYNQPVANNANTADDATLVVYDYDLGRAGWRTMPMANLLTRYTKGSLKPAELNSTYKDTDREVKADGKNQGWRYTYPADKKGRYKSFDEPYTITNLLFVNTYDRDGGGLSGECGGGVVGVSRTYQFCLPTGICTKKEHGYTRDTDTPVQSNATPGLVAMTLGLNGNGNGVGSNHVGNISTTKDSDAGTNNKVDCKANPEAVECLDVEMPSALSQLRWFESRKEGK